MSVALTFGVPASSWAEEVGPPQPKAGRYAWLTDETESASGPLLVVVFLASQRAHVYRGDDLIAVTTISSGRRGYRTPTGVFSILQKKRFHRSNLYDDAPMPFMMRLTWDGLAMHAGALPGYPASHGCIRLPNKFAQQLFAIASYDTRVVVTDDSDVETFAAEYPDAFAPQDREADEVAPSSMQLNPRQSFFWQPGLATEGGPLSILVSAADQRVIVWRGTVEIGRARALVEGGPLGTYALYYARRDADAPLWMRVHLPSPLDEENAVHPLLMGRVRMPETFREHVMELIAPGTTVFFTDRPIAPRVEGWPLTVVAGGGPIIR